ncbi:MAG: heavy-metal-associated domain-containing protein [Clostridia bacterium]|nr:heavy-metal-associated domain-containing protein [Clostridia bacterium]
MLEIILKIDGMACGMCEAHVNDAIRQAFKVKKVSSSHSKGETVIIAEEIDDERIREVIEKTGYKLVEIQKAPYEKRGLFAKFKK